ncbi:MAG: DNA polymerase III subunit delta [Acholeplasmatales bacterium]|nr:DNA polymerase III subunit delta [Acholeplasmatales bacterium]
MRTFIISTDDYSVGKRKIEEIRASITGDVDDSSYDLEEDSLYNIVDDLNTVSLFDNIKFVVCKSAEKIVDFKDSALKEFINILGDQSSNNYLILITTVGFNKIPQDKQDIYKKIKSYSTYYEIMVKNISLEEYIENNVKEDGYSIDSDAKNLLLSYFDNLTAIETSLDILKSYKMEDKIIKKDDVIKMIPKPLDENVYDLINAVLKKDKKLIFQIYDNLKTINAGANILSLLINKFQELYNVNMLVKSGITKDEISEIFHVKPGRAFYMVKDAKNNSLKDIKDNLDYLNKLDYDIKRGVVDSELGIELYFLR